ncbi:MAG TPA: LytTR family DNA-binding domain-containing protein [Gammaproteobacteria bacterium]
MHVLIVDDEAPARLRLRGLLQQIPDVTVAGEAGDGASALKQFDALNPDVVLLDIRMPGMDGLECARHLAGLATPPAVIFTTAYDRFAIEAFEAQAMDYLVKPVRRERLQAALERAGKPNAAQRTALLDGSNAKRRQLCVRVRDNLRLIDLENVFYFRADQKYVTVRHSGGEVLIEDSLKSLEDEFGGDFVRVHRNALVAVRAIDGLEKDEVGHFHVRMREIGERLEVSRRLVPDVRRLIRSA